MSENARLAIITSCKLISYDHAPTGDIEASYVASQKNGIRKQSVCTTPVVLQNPSITNIWVGDFSEALRIQKVQQITPAKLTARNF